MMNIIIVIICYNNGDQMEPPLKKVQSIEPSPKSVGVGSMYSHLIGAICSMIISIIIHISKKSS